MHRGITAKLMSVPVAAPVRGWILGTPGSHPHWKSKANYFLSDSVANSRGSAREDEVPRKVNLGSR